MKKKYLILISSLTIILLVTFAFINLSVKKNNIFTVAYLNSDNNDYFCNLIRINFIDIAKQNNNISVKYADAQNDITKQIDQVNMFIAAKVNVICINPVNQKMILPVIEKAAAAGIKIISINRSLNNDKVIYVGSKDYEAGLLQGNYMYTHLPQNAKILYLSGPPSHKSARDRWRGFYDACLKKRPDIKLLCNLNGNYLKTDGMLIMSVWLQLFPHFDAVIAANDQMALGVISSLKKAHRLDNVLISGIDGTYDALKAIKNGEMTQSVKQDALAQAQESFKLIEDIRQRKKIPNEKIIRFTSITRENLKEYL